MSVCHGQQQFAAHARCRSLATEIEVSGPIAMVVAGLMIGNHGRQFAMNQHTIERLDAFWEMVDEFLNAVLFVLIGLEMLVISFTKAYVWAGLMAVAQETRSSSAW